MAPVTIAPADIAALLPAGARVLVTGASGESALIAEAITGAGEDLGPATFTGIFVPGVNRHTYLANAASKVETFFVTPELKTELGLRVTHFRSDARSVGKECGRTGQSRGSPDH